MYPAPNRVPGLSLSSRAERGYVIVALGGELDITAAPVLREKLLVMLSPDASRLIIDLSAISYADASGLAVLVAIGRRAGLLGGFLRLAAPSSEAAEVLSNTGLDRHLAIVPTVKAAITGTGTVPHRQRAPREYHHEAALESDERQLSRAVARLTARHARVTLA